MELFVPSFEGERKRSTRPAMRVLTAGTARACIHDLLPPRPLSERPVTPDTPFILLILGRLPGEVFVSWAIESHAQRALTHHYEISVNEGITEINREFR